MRSALWGGLFAAVINLLVLGLMLHAQKAEKGTQQWEIPVTGVEAIRLRVFDTTGVCLYLANIYAGDSRALAITAVPKTQLPPGAGCQ